MNLLFQTFEIRSNDFAYSTRVLRDIMTTDNTPTNDVTEIVDFMFNQLSSMHTTLQEINNRYHGVQSFAPPLNVTIRRNRTTTATPSPLVTYLHQPNEDDTNQEILNASIQLAELNVNLQPESLNTDIDTANANVQPPPNVTVRRQRRRRELTYQQTLERHRVWAVQVVTAQLLNLPAPEFGITIREPNTEQEREQLARHQRRLERILQPLDDLEEEDEENANMMDIETIREVPRPKKTITKIVRQNEINEIMNDNCGICLETKTRGETITTCCGHHYCKVCYDAYLESINSRHYTEDKTPRCPHCRKINPRVTEYRIRKKRTSRANT